MINSPKLSMQFKTWCKTIYPYAVLGYIFPTPFLRQFSIKSYISSYFFIDFQIPWNVLYISICWYLVRYTYIHEIGANNQIPNFIFFYISYYLFVFPGICMNFYAIFYAISNKDMKTYSDLYCSMIIFITYVVMK